jgi:hypothetical protein
MAIYLSISRAAGCLAVRKGASLSRTAGAHHRWPTLTFELHPKKPMAFCSTATDLLYGGSGGRR